MCKPWSAEKIWYFHAYICFHVLYLISNGVLAFQSTPKKLLNQIKEAILTTALEKIHIIGENSKSLFWEAKGRFFIFGKIFPNGLSKIKQRVCNLVFHILWELCVQILKYHENKTRRPSLKFVSMALTCPISNGMFLLLNCCKSTPWPK